jgi:hypothetical protein
MACRGCNKEDTSSSCLVQEAGNIKKRERPVMQLQSETEDLKAPWRVAGTSPLESCYRKAEESEVKTLLLRNRIACMCKLPLFLIFVLSGPPAYSVVLSTLRLGLSCLVYWPTCQLSWETPSQTHLEVCFTDFVDNLNPVKLTARIRITKSFIHCMFLTICTVPTFPEHTLVPLSLILIIIYFIILLTKFAKLRLQSKNLIFT